MQRWRWKVADRNSNPQLDLLYEPGNWGDVLKALWTVPVVRALVAGNTEGPLRILDPYAGAPSYPLVPAARERWAGLPPGALPSAAAPFVAKGLVPSTGTLAAACARALEHDVQLATYDADPARRERWHGQPDVLPLDVDSGERALALPAHLVLVDPYDLFECWEALLPRALDDDGSRTLLFYLYNKAPRGAAAHQRYRALRLRLAQLMAQHGAQRDLAVGRLPSDAVLPRAMHEVLLVAPRPLLAQAGDELRRATRELATTLAAQGCFEWDEGSGATR